MQKFKSVMSMVLVCVLIVTLLSSCGSSDKKHIHISYGSSVIDITSATLLDISKTFSHKYYYDPELNEYIFDDNKFSVTYFGSIQDSENLSWDGSSPMPNGLFDKAMYIIFSDKINTLCSVRVGDSVDTLYSKLKSYTNYLSQPQTLDGYGIPRADSCITLAFSIDGTPLTNDDEYEDVKYIYYLSNNNVSHISILSTLLDEEQ